MDDDKAGLLSGILCLLRLPNSSTSCLSSRGRGGMLPGHTGAGEVEGRSRWAQLAALAWAVAA